MSGYFRNKRAFITGGGSGIGEATARLLIARGAHVVICGRSQARLEAAVARIASAGTNDTHLSALTLDVRVAAAVPKAADEAVSRLGGLDILINNAGVTHPGRFLETPQGVFDDLLAVNFMGAVQVTRGFLPHLLRSSAGGHVSFVSSVAGFLGVYGYSAYASSKFALTGFAECLRQELRPQRVGVSVLFPPETDTPLLQAEEALKPEETRAIAGTIRPLSAELVAKAYLDGIASGRTHILPGRETYLLSGVQRLLPGLVRWYMDAQVRKVADRRPK